MQKSSGPGERSNFECERNDATMYHRLVSDRLPQCHVGPDTVADCSPGVGKIQSLCEYRDTHDALPVARSRRDEPSCIKNEDQKLVAELLLDLIRFQNGTLKSNDELTNIVTDLSNMVKSTLHFQECRDDNINVRNERAVLEICKEVYKYVCSDEQALINTIVIMTYLADKCSRMSENEYRTLVDRFAYIILSSMGNSRTVSILKAFKSRKRCKYIIRTVLLMGLGMMGLVYVVRKYW